MSKIDLNKSALKDLENADVAQVLLKDKADQLAEAAKGAAEPFIAKKIKVADLTTRGDKVGWRVAGFDFRSLWFEKGTVKMRAKPFLRPAAAALGFKLSGRK